MTLPTIGRIVHYTLTEADAEAINRRRDDFRHRGAKAEATGHVGHIGNHAVEGEICAATVVRTFGGAAANLQVHLDGNDTYWATSRSEGDGPGFWAWPTRD